jgi:hypothetical protein
MTAEGPPVIARLESFPGVDLPIARGRCYTLVARLGPGAMPGDVVASFRMTTPREKSGGLTGRPSREHPELRSGPHCPLDAGTLGIRLVHRLTYAPVTDAGKGSFEIQLWSAPISDAELAALEQRHAAILRKIDSLPADCDDCGFNCRRTRDHCERRCFVNHRERYDRDRCEETCEQIGDACESGCDARCR